MKLKRKTVRRLLLLSLALVMLAGAGAAVHFVRNSRNEARLEARRVMGLQAAAAGDLRTAVDQLGGYIKRRSDDAEVWLAYARSRRNLEERDGRHLAETVGAYNRYLALRDDDQAARRELLESLAEAGMDAEVIDTARRLRPADPAALTAEHLDVLRYEVAARQNRRDLGKDTFVLARRAVELDPNDFGSRIRLASLFAAAQRPDEAAEFVAQTGRDFPGDPRVLLLRYSMGAASETTPRESLNALAAVAGLDPETGSRKGPPMDASEIVLAMLVNGFDSMARPDLALSVLEPRAAKGELGYVRAFARRALYSGSYERLVKLQASHASEASWNAADVLALVALSLQAMERSAESGAIFDRLKEIQGSYRATSWTLARPVLLDYKTPASQDAIQVMRSAVTENPVEPIFLARLAELLLQVGRTDEARAELAAAERSPLSDGWARPGVLRVRTFLAEDRLAEALKVSTETARRFPADPAAAATLLAIRSEMLDRGFTDSSGAELVAERLGDALEGLRSNAGGSIPPELRNTFIASFAVAADKAGDADRAREALRLAAESDDQFSAQALSRLVEISRRRGFGFDKALLERAERGGADPRIDPCPRHPAPCRVSDIRGPGPDPSGGRPAGESRGHPVARPLLLLP